MVVVAAWPYRLCGLRGLLRRGLLATDVFSNNSGDPQKGGVSVAGGIVTLGVTLLALFFCVYTVISAKSSTDEILTPAPNAVQSSIGSDVPPEMQLFFQWRFLLTAAAANCSEICNSIGGSAFSGLTCGVFNPNWQDSGRPCSANWLSPVLTLAHPPLAYNTSSTSWQMGQLYVGSYVRWQGLDPACHREFEGTALDDVLLFNSYSMSKMNPIRGAARFRRVYFNVDSTLSRQGEFSSPCFADGALFDSFRATSGTPLISELFTLQLAAEPYPQMAVPFSNTFTLAASVFSILGAAVGLIRPVTSSWQFAKGCVRKYPLLQLFLSFVAVALCIGAGFALQFGYAIKNNLFQSELLLVYVFLMSAGLAALFVWIAHSVRFLQTNRANGWSTQSAPLLSP